MLEVYLLSLFLWFFNQIWHTTTLVFYPIVFSLILLELRQRLKRQVICWGGLNEQIVYVYIENTVHLQWLLFRNKINFFKKCSTVVLTTIAFLETKLTTYQQNAPGWEKYFRDALLSIISWQKCEKNCIHTIYCVLIFSQNKSRWSINISDFKRFFSSVYN